MAISHFATGTAATGTTSVTPSYPANWQAGDLGIVTIASGQTSENTPTSPAGWVYAGSFSGGGGTFGGGTGPRRVTFYVRELQSGDDTAPTFSLASGNNCIAAVTVLRKEVGDGAWMTASSFGADTSAGTGFSVTCSNDPGVAAGDHVILGFAIRDSCTQSNTGISTTGVTYGTINEQVDTSSETGNDNHLGVFEGPATAGTSSAAPVITSTLSGSESGAAGVLRVRIVDVGNPIRLWPATNGPSTNFTDASSYTLSTEFEVSEECNATRAYIWCRSSGQNTASQTVILYRVDSATAGTEIDRTTSGTLTTNSWNEVLFNGPITLVPGQRYRICYTASPGSASSGFSSTASYWSSGDGSAGITNGILTAPNETNATGNDQGGFFFGGLGFPNSSASASNYWIDIGIQAETTATEANAGNVLADVNSEQPKASIRTNSSAASLTAVANNTAASVRGSGGSASAIAAANNPTISNTSRANAVTAGVTATANGITAKSSPTPITATAASVSEDAGGSVKVDADFAPVNAHTRFLAEPVTANVVASANDATVSTEAADNETNANAVTADVSADANNSTTSVKASAGIAGVDAVTGNITSVVKPTADDAAVSAVARDANPGAEGNTDADAGVAGVGADANQPNLSVKVNAGVASITAEANGSTVIVKLGAEVAEITAVANGTKSFVDVSAGGTVVVSESNDTTSTVKTTPTTASISVDAEDSDAITGSFVNVHPTTATVDVNSDTTSHTTVFSSEGAVVAVSAEDAAIGAASSVQVDAGVASVSVAAGDNTATVKTTPEGIVVTAISNGVSASMLVSASAASVITTATDGEARQGQSVAPQPALVGVAAGNTNSAVIANASSASAEVVAEIPATKLPYEIPPLKVVVKGVEGTMVIQTTGGIVVRGTAPITVINPGGSLQVIDPNI